MTDAGVLRLTVPRRASVDAGLRFIRTQVDWIARERLRRTVAASKWQTGSPVWYRGTLVPLVLTDTHVEIGDLRWPCPVAGVDVRRSVEGQLRVVAERELPARCLELAARHGLVVTRVSVRSQRSRWGSCSTRGTVALNWRLIQMPPAVADYVILHELMHLRQPNHSRAFWREVASVCAGWREAEAWLRTHGRDIL